MTICFQNGGHALSCICYKRAWTIQEEYFVGHPMASVMLIECKHFDKELTKIVYAEHVRLLVESVYCG